MKKVLAVILLICLSVFLLTGCQDIFINSSKKERAFVTCYNNYVKPTLENSDTVVITSVSESVDANGGTLVRFKYEYTTDAGYKTSRSLYLVTSKITIDSSLITLSELNESMYGDKVVKLNGKSVDEGFVAESIQSYSTNEDMQIISLWKSVQIDRTYATTYDVDMINNLINK